MVGGGVGTLAGAGAGPKAGAGGEARRVTETFVGSVDGVGGVAGGHQAGGRSHRTMPTVTAQTMA